MVRTGAPAGHRGYFHEALLYQSDEEFLATALPFVQDGVAAGEPVVVALGDRSAALVQAALGDTAGVDVYVNGGVGAGVGRYANPVDALSFYRETFTEHAAAGVGQVRVLGETPHPGLGQPWEWWARYEATANHAFAAFPVWGLCPYDLRRTSAAVLEDVTRSHPYLVGAAGAHRGNPRYRDPAQFLTGRAAALLDPLLAHPARVELIDPTPAVARAAVRDTAGATALARVRVEDMVLAVNEAVTNATCHGRRPARLRIWTALERVVATVTDGGPGPTDPYAGLLPTFTAAGGRGLWMMHRLCSHVTFHRDEQGFTLGLVAGRPVLEGGGDADHRQ
jgi:anti-sigma regulatory factor (Ser/Thr protein kinase)